MITRTASAHNDLAITFLVWQRPLCGHVGRSRALYLHGALSQGRGEAGGENVLPLFHICNPLGEKYAIVCHMKQHECKKCGSSWFAIERKTVVHKVKISKSRTPRSRTQVYTWRICAGCNKRQRVNRPVTEDDYR